jgi:hypothetical protein
MHGVSAYAHESFVLLPANSVATTRLKRPRRLLRLRVKAESRSFVLYSGESSFIDEDSSSSLRFLAELRS